MPAQHTGLCRDTKSCEFLLYPSYGIWIPNTIYHRSRSFRGHCKMNINTTDVHIHVYVAKKCYLSSDVAHTHTHTHTRVCRCEHWRAGVCWRWGWVATTRPSLRPVRSTPLARTSANLATTAALTCRPSPEPWAPEIHVAEWLTDCVFCGAGNFYSCEIFTDVRTCTCTYTLHGSTYCTCTYMDIPNSHVQGFI